MEKIKKISAVFSIISSICIILIWAISTISGLIIIDFNNIKASQISLLSAEFLTSVILFISGFGILLKKIWSEKLILISYGMLLYALIIGAGAFFEKGFTAVVILFIFVITAAIVLIFFNIFYAAKRIR